MPSTVSSAPKSRKYELDVLTVILCMLVIFIHVTSEPVTRLASGPAYLLIISLWRLASFVVQGFIFISAVKFFLKVRGGSFKYLPFLWGRFKSVVVPYLFAVAVFYAYFIRAGYYNFSAADLIRYIFVGDLVSPFYFVVTIVQFYLLMPLWIFIVKRLSPYIALPASLVITLIFWRYLPQLLGGAGLSFAYNDRVFTTYLFYWVAGCYIGYSYDKFIGLCRRFTVPWAVLTAMLAGIMVWWAGSFALAGAHLGWGFEYLRFAFVAGAVFLAYRLSVLAAGGGPDTKSTAAKFQIRSMGRRLILSISRASYYIFLFHCLFIYVINSLMNRCGLERALLRYGVRILFVYVISIVLCIGYAELKKMIMTHLKTS